MKWHILKWNTNFHSEIFCSHFSSEHTTHCASVYWKCNNIWDVGKCHKCYIVVFHFLFNKVDSVSAAAVASILSSTSSNWNNSFLIFLTSPICHVCEFCLETGGQDWETVIFATGLACGDVLGRIWIDGNIANFAFSKVHFVTIFLSYFMSISLHSLMSLLCKLVISWCLLTKSIISKSIAASFFTSVLYSFISTIITYCSVVMFVYFTCTLNFFMWFKMLYTCVSYMSAT